MGQWGSPRTPNPNPNPNPDPLPLIAIGLSQDTMLFAAFCGARWLRLADGPDEVHWRTAARIELGKQKFSPFEEIPYYNEYDDVDPNKVFRRSTDPISIEAQTHRSTRITALTLNPRKEMNP